jgi:hypothetical protein
MTFSAPYLCLMHFSKAQIATLKSTVLIEFRTPPSVLPLTKEGGSEVIDSFCVDLDSPGWSAQIHGLQWISDPLLRYAFNGRGGVRDGYNAGADLDDSKQSA